MFRFVPINGKRARLLLAAGLALEAAAIALTFATERSAQRTDQARVSVFQKAGAAWKRRLANADSGGEVARKSTRAGTAWRTRIAEPIVLPPSLDAKTAKLGPDEKVIGIEVGGRAQAYRFAAFESMSGHLVNDLVGGIPVSVAYCDLTQCLRVYSDPQGSQPLELNVAGVLYGEMIVRHVGKMYFHKTGKEAEPAGNEHTLPFRLITPTVTTWKEWTAQHPDTRVYVAKPGDAASVQQQPSHGAVH